MVACKETQKIEEYQPLRDEIGKSWDMKKVIVIPVLNGALEVVRSIRTGKSLLTMSGLLAFICMYVCIPRSHMMVPLSPSVPGPERCSYKILEGYQSGSICPSGIISQLD